MAFLTSVVVSAAIIVATNPGPAGGAAIGVLAYALIKKWIDE